MMKRYAGGLVVSTEDYLYIGSLGFRLDDESVSFTVWWLLFLLKRSISDNDKERTKSRSILGLDSFFVCDVQRFFLSRTSSDVST